MATRQEVLEGFDKTLAKIREQARHFRMWNKNMQYHFEDLGEAWFISINEGEPAQPQEGVADGAEIVYRMDSDTFVGIVGGSISGMDAWKQGKVKLQASAMDMMKLQKLN